MLMPLLHFAGRLSKMQTCRTRLRIVILPEFYISLALVILLIPVKWVLAWFFAASIHEFFHYICLRLCGCNIYHIQIGHSGAIMETDLSSRRKEFICALAGPFGGLALLFAAKWFPRAALCAFFQSLYNLLPVLPLDGGRALNALLVMLFKEFSAEKISRIIGNIFLIIVLLLSIYAAYALCLGLIPLILAGLLLWKSKRVKIPCKECCLRVQ